MSGRRGRPIATTKRVTTPVNVRVTGPVYDRAFTLARQMGVSVPRVFRAALERALRNDGDEIDDGEWDE